MDSKQEDIEPASASRRILVMGVGRSGTTAIYALLQHILEDSFPGRIDYVYEPFLWDRSTFNKRYVELTDEFRFVSSLSVEGIYHHKRLPIFSDEKSVIDENTCAWLLDTLSPHTGKSHYLGKFIRATGRVGLIRELVPSAKIIFIIRNPVDVLNSSAQLFSLFGRDFHQSDFKRFSAEVALKYGNDLQTSIVDETEIEAEYAYWYFLNHAFLQYAPSNTENVLSIAYEAFIENQFEVLKRICEFIELDFKPDFAEASKINFGPVRHKLSALTRSDYLFVKSKLESYEQLLELVDCRPSAPLQELVKTSTWNETEDVRRDRPALNTLHLSIVREERRRLSEVLSQILNSKRYRLMNWLLSPIDFIRKHTKKD